MYLFIIISYKLNFKSYLIVCNPVKLKITKILFIKY